MKGCPLDTNGDGDCYACSKPDWRCNGEHPVYVPTGEPMRSMRVDWNAEGVYTISPSTGEPTFPEWDFVTTIELIEILDPTPQEKP